MPKLLPFLVLSVCVGTIHAQQPFLTDDTDTAPLHHIHLELLNEFDRLQDSAFPTLRQNTSRFQMTYGLLSNVEIGFDVPLLSIFNSRSADLPDAFGPGDLDLQVKYRVHDEHAGSPLPAATLALYVEAPTGNSKNQLGSGIADYWLNGILQKGLTERLTVRLNSGLLFSGNTLTGAVGIRSPRGRVFTGSSSITYQCRPRLLVGAEIAGAFTQQSDLGKAQVQVLGGGKFLLRKSVGLDFAVTGGKFEGSPRVGGSLGISLDF